MISVSEDIREARIILDVFHPTRIKILRAILEGANRVVDIAKKAEANASSIYSALNNFQKYGLVNVEYEGARPKYVATERAKRLIKLYDEFIREVKEVVKE